MVVSCFLVGLLDRVFPVSNALLFPCVEDIRPATAHARQRKDLQRRSRDSIEPMGEALGKVSNGSSAEGATQCDV
jgi:hypothetical protein